MPLRIITLCALILCVGCQPQTLYDKSVSVTSNDITPILFGPFSKESTVSIEFETSGPPVLLYVHPEDQREQVEYAISYEKEPPSVLAGSNSVESDSYQVIVPADTEVAVTIKGTTLEESKVQLRISK